MNAHCGKEAVVEGTREVYPGLIVTAAGIVKGKPAAAQARR